MLGVYPFYVLMKGIFCMFVKLFSIRLRLFLFSLIILMILLILSTIPYRIFAETSGTTFYVDATLGDDGNACTSAGVDACATIGAAMSKASAGDSIQIAAGIYIENLQTPVSNLTIIGENTETTIIDGGGTGRVLWNTLPSTISDVTIRNGFADSSNLSGYGAGILATDALTLTNVTIMSNTGSTGSGITSQNASAVVILQNSRVISNSATSDGGGVYAYSFSTLSITNTLIAGNTAGFFGGGILQRWSSILSLANVTVRDNTAELQLGGGLYQSGGTLTATHSVFYHNQAISGAGVTLSDGVATFTNVTISENTATNDNGGVRTYNVIGPTIASIENSTIANNHNIGTTPNPVNGIQVGTNTTVTVKSSIIANNDTRNCNSTAPPTSAGYNLVDNYDCQFFDVGDQQNVDPKLGSLGDYGGATWTMPVLIGSPAIDAADNAACPPTDQRGIARPVDGNADGTTTCDIGAYEAQNQLTISDVSLAEGNSGTIGAVFTVTLVPTTTQVVSVTYATADGSAIAGNDYTATGGSLVFGVNEITKTISIPILGDTVDESDETFTVILSNPINAELIDAVGLGAIVDDDGLSSLTIADATVQEGDSGTIIAAFDVTLSPATESAIAVDYATANATASAGSDYIAVGDTLTFNAGETTKTISVTVNGDVVDEGSGETFTVNLSSPSGASLADSQAVGTITDDDDAQFGIYAPVNYTVMEGDSGTTSAVFTVTLSLQTQFTATVDYEAQSSTSLGFATVGSDFITTTGTLTFSAGETEQFITVPIIGDSYLEADERLSVQLSNGFPTVYIGAASATILNDDLWTTFIYLPLIVR